MIVAIDGGDASGKTTIAQLIAKVLKGQVQPFPDDNDVTGPMIRAYLAKKWAVDITKDWQTGSFPAFQYSIHV